MCRYCKNVVTGDNWENLLETEISFNAGNKHKVSVLDVDVGITYDGELQLGIASNGSELSYKYIKIKYCPICGTKLKDLKCIEED